MSETAGFVAVRRDNPDGSRKTIKARLTINSAAPTSGTYPVAPGSFDDVAVWVNEGGAGGEVVR